MFWSAKGRLMQDMRSVQLQFADLLCRSLVLYAVEGVLAAVLTDRLDDSHISHISSSSEHEAFLQQQPKLAKVRLEGTARCAVLWWLLTC
jgi:hypothetical protein